MNAVALFGKEDLRPVKMELKKPDRNDLIIRIISCGLCGSDVRMYFNGPTPRYKHPIVLGHEIAGEVAVVGQLVKDFSIGDKITLAPIVPCMNCSPCKRGDDHLCETGEVVGTTIDGGFADFMYVPEAMLSAGGLVHIPTGVEPYEASLTETLSCCIHGLKKVPSITNGRVLIIGDGPIGLTFLQLAKLKEVKFIATSGRRQTRRMKAEKLGADVVVDAKENDLKKVFNELFDLVIIANSSTETIADAIHLTRSGGDIIFFSGYPYGTQISIDPNIVHYRELQIHGSIDATIEDFKEAVELLPQLHMRELITDTYPIGQINKAFNIAKSGDVIKVLITP